MHLLPQPRPFRLAALLFVSCLLAPAAHAQAQFAGTYLGTVNTKIFAGGFGIESGFGVYTATVTAGGAIDVNGGQLTGTVTSGGAVTFDAGSSLASLGIRSATIAGNQLSSAYGDLVASGTSQYKLNASTSFTASGGSAPTISTQPVTQTVAVGGSATFSVTASGGTLTYQWKLNNSALTGALSATLTLTNVQAANAGSYTVDVTNISGTTTSSAAILTVTPSAGQLFVTNLSPGTVGEYTATGTTVNTARVSGLTTFTAYGLAVSGTDLFVTNSGGGVAGQGKVGKYTTAGTAVNASFITGLNLPFGIAVSGTDLYVANRNAGTVGKYNATTGAVVNASLVSGLNDPCAVAVSGTDLYVAIVGNGAGLGTVGKYSTSGTVINAAFITGLSGPYGIAVSGTDLFVSNNGSGSNRIGKYNASTGAVVNAAFITGLNLPYGLATDGTSLYVTNAGANSIGKYDNATGATISAALVTGLNNPSGIAIVAGAPGRLINLSVRSAAGTGAQTLIAGFVVTGTGNKPLLLRGMGPALIPYGVVTAMTDPVLRLYNAGGTQIDTNDDWGGGTTMIDRFNALVGWVPVSASKDAALNSSIATGAYTFHVVANTGSPGVALAELYDAETAEGTAKVMNISARTQVGTGENVLIAGFVITGGTARTLLIRGVGPTLAGYGVDGALVDPQLHLYNGATLVTTNDNWGGTQTLKDAFTTLGAVALASDASKDAALLVTLQPGIYSAQVSGIASTTGVGLVEIYLMP